MKKLMNLILLLVVGITLNSCSSGNRNSSSVDTTSSTSAEISIDATTIVPVVNGVSTQSQVYIRNNSDVAVSGISYSLGSTGTSSQNNPTTSTDGTSEDANGFKRLSTQECSVIQAHGYCALTFATPNLSVGSQGSALLTVNYTGVNGVSTDYSQVISYQFVNLATASGVNFNGSLDVVGKQGTTQHITAYLLAGGSSGQLYNNVRLISSNTGQVGISNGFINDTQLAAGQVIAVEIMVKMTNSSGSNAVITPSYNETNSNFSSQALLQAGATFGTPLGIAIVPNPAKGGFSLK